MGRDVTGLRANKKPSVVDVKTTNGSNHDDAAQNSPEKTEMEEYESNEHEEDVVDEEGADQEPSNDHDHSTKESLSNSSKTHQYDDEDCSSNSSTSTSAHTVKFKVTVPVAPKFTCEERLGRRKEYYAKLEERHKAMEKEKLENEARIKEEEQAAIRELRKSMVVKAKPVPSFYREGPPPKVELKKIPVTRAKSPKLTRRRSCGDAGKCCEDETKRCERENRCSVGTCKDTKNSHGTSKCKNRTNTKKSNENSKVKDQVKDNPEEQEEDADDVES